MTAPTPAPAWTGWVRLSGKRWQAVVTGADEDSVWRLLRQHVEQLGARLVDTLVAAANVDPNEKTRRRRF